MNWYRENVRDLPWRRTLDPYAIWISEVMLQQTQVSTVVPYWRRWMRELPTIRSLAGARPDRVLKLWEGLGYYTRARNLRKAARAITAECDGRLPSRYDEVLALPGVGPYTAGAICSIAFNQPTPALDGNVIRVLTRLFGIEDNPRDKHTRARLRDLAGTLLAEAAARQRGEERNCSDLNQGLMELGAVICTPRQPVCPLCPVHKQCVAHRENRIDELPNLGRRPVTIKRRFVAFIVQNNGRLLVRRRPDRGINAQLWEFPNVEVTADHPDPARLATDLLGPCRLSLTRLFRLRHTITRSRITLDVFRAEVRAGFRKSVAKGRWFSAAALQRLAFAGAHRRIRQRLAAPMNL